MKLELKYLKDYFGDRMEPYSMDTLSNEVKAAVQKLNPVNKAILFEIGIPAYDGDGGEYTPLQHMKIYKGKYLRIYTRQYDGQYYTECIDLDSNGIIFINKVRDPESVGYINKDLEAYLNYVIVVEKFWKEYVLPEKLGKYSEYKNFSIYANALKEQFIEVDKRLYPNEAKKYGIEVSDGWYSLLSEIEAGVI